MLVGTLDYVAPEQISGSRVDARADVYALGCATYQVLSSGVPFPRDSEIAKLSAHLDDPPPRLADVPPPLAGAVERPMAKGPGDRFLSAGDLDGRWWQARLGAATRAPDGPWPPGRRRSMIAPGVAVASGGGGSSAGSQVAPP